MDSFALHRIGLVLFVFVFSWIGFCAAEEPVTAKQKKEQEVRDLIRELGDASYFVREKAQNRLLRIGIDALPALKKATRSEDIEIAKRAEQIIGQFELFFYGRENNLVRSLLNTYADEQNIAEKASIIWLLSNPVAGYGYQDGEGFRSLCRIARFDTEHALRAEAAKCLIGMPPNIPSKRNKWYRALRQVFTDSDEDDLVILIRDFAQLRCEIDLLREETEQETLDRARSEGHTVDFPVPLAPSKELLEKTARFRERLTAFQTDPDNSRIQPGNRIDILLHYAMAEIEDDLGLRQELDRTLEAARTMQVEPIRSEEPLLPNNPLSGEAFNDHYYVGYILFERNRYRWALPHLTNIGEDGDPGLRVAARSTASNVAHLLGEPQEALAYLEQALEILASKIYSERYNNAELRKNQLLPRKIYFQALLSSEADDWQQTVKYIDEILGIDPFEIDTIILRYEACRHLPELGEDYRARMKPLVENAINQVEKDIREGSLKLHVGCNQVAWLLANTGGDYPTALAMIRETVRREPESPMYLDTQAHVFALGKDYQKAIETQEKAVRIAPESKEFRKALDRFKKLATQE